jgi:hypothetical protein
MNSDPANCPFCNGVLPALSKPATADKLPCPRCGELVPAARWLVDASIASGPPPAKAAVVQPEVPGTRKTMLIVVGIMLTMAVIGLSYALWTTKLRRSRDPRPMLDPVTFHKPYELAGLGYLPKDSQVIVGLHIAEWLADKTVGKPLLEEPRPAALDWIVKQLPRVTGLPLEDLDHVVLAGSFEDLQLVMVIKARRPFDLGKIAEHAKPSNTPLHQEKALYPISLTMAEALVWCVEEKTLVCVIRLDAPEVKHLQGLSTTPRQIDEVLSAPLIEAMKERLPKRNLLWAVGRLDHLGVLKDMLPFVPAAKPYVEATKNLKIFALGLEPGDDLTLTGHFRMTDAKAAAKIKTILEGIEIKGAKSQKVEVPPADQEPWVTWQVRGDVAVMREWLNQGKDAKK